MMRAPYILFVGLLGTAVIGCSHAKEEAGALLRSIEVYRGASDIDKQAAVEKVPATTITGSRAGAGAGWQAVAKTAAMSRAAAMTA